MVHSRRENLSDYRKG